MFKKQFFLSFAFSLTGFYFLSAKSGFYHTYPRFDVPTHFLGGMAAALFFSIYFKRNLKNSSPFLVFIFLLSVTALAGVLWEFFEWGMDHFLMPRVSWVHLSQLSLEDTLGDLFMDLLGGLFLAFLYLYDRTRKSAD